MCSTAWCLCRSSGCSRSWTISGAARSTQVARALGLDGSTVTRLADRLVAAGYVIRGSDLGNRTVVTLELTDTGRDLVTQVAGGAARS